jgi:DegV family protein with EDD domain
MIAILTDSTCDIPEVLVDQYDIRIVAQYIIWGEVQFLDRVELSPQAFYERLGTDAHKPTSSQATAADFSAAINQAVEDGADEAVILTVSSAMSGTYQMAISAAEKAQIPVSVIDSKGPTMSLGWQTLAAARARDEGALMAEIVDRVARVRDNLVQVVGMETLEYLAYGGRIGDAAKWVGTMLKVKPVVMINHESGRVEPAGLARTHKSMLRMLEKKFFEAIGTGKKLHIAVLHGNVLDEAERLAEHIHAEYNPAELLINITGPVLGINTGPGALALCGYGGE